MDHIFHSLTNLDIEYLKLQHVLNIKITILAYQNVTQEGPYNKVTR